MNSSKWTKQTEPNADQLKAMKKALKGVGGWFPQSNIPERWVKEKLEWFKMGGHLSMAPGDPSCKFIFLDTETDTGTGSPIKLRKVQAHDHYLSNNSLICAYGSGIYDKPFILEGVKNENNGRKSWEERKIILKITWISFVYRRGRLDEGPHWSECEIRMNIPFRFHIPQDDHAVIRQFRQALKSLSYSTHLEAGITARELKLGDNPDARLTMEEQVKLLCTIRDPTLFSMVLSRISNIKLQRDALIEYQRLYPKWFKAIHEN